MRPPRGRLVRRIGTAAIALGLALIAWSAVTALWNDPVTSLYTRWQQHRLGDELAELRTQFARRRATSSFPARKPWAAAFEARRLRVSAHAGTPLGRIVVPRLGVDMIVVFGTDPRSLKKGPGLHADTFLPGEGNLVYIAGHRTTFAAPFAKIDSLRPGDRIALEMPYGDFEYTVSGHQIVDDRDLSVLRQRRRETVALQACHPRFFASQRYIVWARPARLVTGNGRVYAVGRPAPG